MTQKELCRVAVEARKHAYAPYSGVKVGAALMTTSGKVYTGCNIENAAFSPTMCAERVAFAKAISEGEREFLAIAVAGGKGDTVDGACPPCGVCRQVMAEFCRPDFLVMTVTGEDTFTQQPLMKLLPQAFTPKNL